MAERPASERIKDFRQVNLGYTNEQAVEEAKRCLQCKKPFCVDGCPVEIDIPGFIKAIAAGNPLKAAAVLKQKNNLPAICGRVCPQEEQCEIKCILHSKGEPIGIGNLERFAADFEKEHYAKNNRHTALMPKNGIKVAVIGSGPAGLTCAGDLVKMGYLVTVYESLHKSGGVLRYGIPEFRLPDDILDYEIENLAKLGVNISLNTLVGRTKSVAELFDEGYKAVFIGTGAGLPNFLGVPGENLNHVYSANEFLVRVNLMRAFEFPLYDTPIYVGGHVVVIGGGNTAIDAARTALRLGAEEVNLVYRRSEQELPARREEVVHAQEEGVRLRLLTNPVKFSGDENGFVKEMECVKMELGDPDSSGRRRPKLIQNSNFTIRTDMAIIAIGLSPNPVLPSLTEKLERDDEGHLKIDDKYMTSIKGVFAGGDIVGGETVIQAMGMGKKAARSMNEYLKEINPKPS
ncbi:MAG: NADPH-dependent glutamate synthase [Endomicrobiales bacterium]|nr:NADPH-dependent glutamate synthase [Endomicrobiales bacterium]